MLDDRCAVCAAWLPVAWQRADLYVSSLTHPRAAKIRPHCGVCQEAIVRNQSLVNSVIAKAEHLLDVWEDEGGTSGLRCSWGCCLPPLRTPPHGPSPRVC